MCVMLANRANTISCLILGLVVCPLVLWNLFFWMFGGLFLSLLGSTPIMSALLMIIANLCGFISCAISQNFFNASNIFRIFLNVSLIAKFMPSKPIGGRVPSTSLLLWSHRGRSPSFLSTCPPTEWLCGAKTSTHCWHGTHTLSTCLNSIEFFGRCFSYCHFHHKLPPLENYQ